MFGKEILCVFLCMCVFFSGPVLFLYLSRNDNNLIIIRRENMNRIDMSLSTYVLDAHTQHTHYIYQNTTHARTDARTHERKNARTHAHTNILHIHTDYFQCK